MNISSRQLEAFIAVADLLSFTEAAEKMHMSQPSLSQLMQQLEMNLEASLFIRSTRKVRLSEAGKSFYPVAERVLNRLTRGVQDLRDLQDGQVGRVSFAALLTVGASLVPAMMAEFKERYPKVVLEYIEESEEPIYRQVSNGDIDFGIGVLPDTLEEVSFSPIYKDYLYFVCSPNHPLANADLVSWQQIVNYPFLALKSGTSMRKLTEKGFALTDVLFKPIQEAVYQSTILGMIACDLGVSVLPSSLKLMFERDDVCLIPIKERLYREIGVIVAKNRELSKASKDLIAVMNQLVNENRALLPRPD